MALNFKKNPVIKHLSRNKRIYGVLVAGLIGAAVLATLVVFCPPVAAFLGALLPAALSSVALSLVGAAIGFGLGAILMGIAVVGEKLIRGTRNPEFEEIVKAAKTNKQREGFDVDSPAPSRNEFTLGKTEVIRKIGGKLEPKEENYYCFNLFSCCMGGRPRGTKPQQPLILDNAVTHNQSL